MDRGDRVPRVSVQVLLQIVGAALRLHEDERQRLGRCVEREGGGGGSGLGRAGQGRGRGRKFGLYRKF